MLESHLNKIGKYSNDSIKSHNVHNSKIKSCRKTLTNKFSGIINNI